MMGKEEINMKMITGIFYSQHKLDVDHDSIIEEIKESREFPQKYESSFSHRQDYFEKGYVHHTFYEDTNLYNHTVRKVHSEVTAIVDKMFGKDMLLCNEVWGHIIPPGDQTMVHDHSSRIPVPGLSFAYYPHVLDNGGNIIFLTQVNGKKCSTEHEIEKGDLLIFSSEMLHFTPRNGSDQTRVTISGNFKPSGEFLDILNDDEKNANPYWYYQGKN